MMSLQSSRIEVYVYGNQQAIAAIAVAEQALAIMALPEERLH